MTLSQLTFIPCLALTITLTFDSCKQRETNEITIGSALYDNQDYKSNRHIRLLIQKTLEKDAQSLLDLINTDCGQAAGCYDLGFIVTQIIYSTGEKKFIEMLKDFNERDLDKLTNLIHAGLEYGDNDKDEKIDNRLMNDQFPMLDEFLMTKKK